MVSQSRRDFLVSTCTAAAMAATPTTLVADAVEPPVNPTLASAFAQLHEIKALPFDPAKLDGLSEKLLLSHWQNNYADSVKALNAVKQKLIVYLEEHELPAFIYNALKREHLMRTGSVVLHDLYFGNIGAGGKVDNTVNAALTQAFGSFANWEKEFRRIGVGLGGGSGWVVLGYNLHHGLLENYWQWDHLHAPTATLPILVMDMYEHSYQMDYGAAAPAYVNAFFRNIHWQTVSARLDNARKARTVWLPEA